MGSCTTCLVILKKVSIPTNLRNELEQEHAMARGFSPFERLACQTLATDGMEILIPPPLTPNE
jgi:ferredoxin